MSLSRRLACLLLLLVAGPLLAAPMKVTFNGVEYLHRWSQGGQNEYTPAGQEDLGRWQDMLGIAVRPQVADGDQLASLANGVLANYEKVGKVVRTDSKPRTAQAEAEHLIVAVLAAPGVVEAVFARLVLVDGRGVVVVVSRRAYGDDAGAAIGPWLEANGPAIEAALMAWDGIPGPDALATLPQAQD